MSRQRKRDAVLRLLRGEDLDTVSRSLVVAAATLSGWSKWSEESSRGSVRITPFTGALWSVQSKRVSGVTSPSLRAPEAATILKTEPGSYMSETATLRSRFSSSRRSLLYSLRSKVGVLARARMNPVRGSLTMMVAFCGRYFSAIRASSSSAMCCTTASIDSTTLYPSDAGTCRERNWASSTWRPSFSDSTHPFWPCR